MNFKVIFHLDGAGVYYDAHEPIHLDALLAWALVPMNRVRCDLSRGDVPDEIPLPLVMGHYRGSKVWRASALFPDGETFETLRFWRKKFRQSRVELTSGTPNLQNGTYREYNMPVPLLLTRKLIAYASGNCKEVKRILKKNIRALGKKRAYGYGRIVDIETEHIDEDWSWLKDGVAMRWLPSSNGALLVRATPPYWNTVGRVPCCEIGDRIEITAS